MLSIQAVTVVTNHNQFYNGHAWMDTSTKGNQPQTRQAYPRVHLPNSEAWETRQAIP